jgi:NitT/TauT family transport system substrate-binding protein
MKKRIASVISGVAIAAMLLMSACSPAKPADDITIRVALLPVLDVLPIVVAQEEGLFEQHGVKVELISVGSAPERDQLISSGQADAMMNELISVMLLNQSSLQVQAVRYARAATAEQPLFSIMAPADAGITDAQGLKNVPVGISQATIIEYLMTLLASGELGAATLPEPFTTLAKQQGAVVALDDSIDPELSFSVYSVRKQMIDEHPEAVKAFLAAIEDAVSLINANPQNYASLMVDQKMVPAPIADTFQVPTYPTKGVPTQAQFDDELAWVKAKGYLSGDASYSDNVNGSLLP